jgi:sugar (pentulose or hexulose) kinase
MGGPTLLSLDCGTQSVRALLFDVEGTLLARTQVVFEPAYHSPEPGWAEQPADYYWDCLAQACQQLWDQPGVDKAAIAGVALTTQRATVVPVDRNGKALHPAILWLDQREAGQLPPLSLHWQALFRAVGETDTIDHLRRQVEANWLAAERPQVWRQTHKFLLLSGYLGFRLGGRFTDSVASQVGYIPFDYKRQQWCRPWDWKWEAMPVRRSQLPDLVPVGGRLGQITAEAAAATGIPQGLPLIAAGADKACEVLGSGCINPEQGALSFGTTATINTVQSRYIEATPLLPPYPAAVPGRFCTEVQTLRGFWMVNWFKEEFAHRELTRAMETGQIVETLFEDFLQSTPAGAMGLMLQPYWSPGIREPGREAKGALIGFGDVHTRAHVYRAIIEGLAYALREGREKIEKRSGQKLRVLRVSGGGSQSDAVVQIMADVFGLPAERPHTFETSGLGAAICTAVGLGLYRDHDTAVRRMVRVGQRFQPDAKAHRLYNSLYKRVYQPLYGQLQPLYREIRRITGYPR